MYWVSAVLNQVFGEKII